MPHPVFAPASTALITGAASGIGLAVAQICRKHGMNLALLDNNASLLSSAKASLSKISQRADAETKLETYDLDVSKLEEWRGVRKKIEGTFPGGIDLLMLNAGIGLKGEWSDAEYFHKIMDVNLMGQVYGVNTMVDLVRRDGNRPSAVVMTGSKQGITNPPGNPAYNASKSAIKTLAEHLSYDFRSTSTSVHLLVPGWTFTGLSGGAPDSTQAKPEGAWSPMQVAEFMEQKMGEDEFWILCPDGQVTEEDDKKRMMWTAGDAVFRRKPLSRWREEYKEESVEWMAQQKF